MTDNLRAGRAAKVADDILKGTFDPPFALLAARGIEDEIERRGLWEQYADVLEHLTQQKRMTYRRADDDVRWRLIRATPEQRARAFLDATKGAGE